MAGRLHAPAIALAYSSPWAALWRVHNAADCPDRDRQAGRIELPNRFEVAGNRTRALSWLSVLPSNPAYAAHPGLSVGPPSVRLALQALGLSHLASRRRLCGG
jgi:hypothetical protein